MSFVKQRTSWLLPIQLLNLATCLSIGGILANTAFGFVTIPIMVNTMVVGGLGFTMAFVSAVWIYRCIQHPLTQHHDNLAQFMNQGPDG